MTSEPDEPAITEMFQGIAAKIDNVDREVRAEWTGKPADQTEPAAETAFASIGLDMTGKLREYAEAVERDEPFQFHLG